MKDDDARRMVRSMAIRRQRLLLSEIGDRVGTRVAYLKAAWADPVLYGARGERSGVDVDVLVSSSRFEAFAAELTRAGFTRQEHPRHPVSAYAGKDWTFDAPPGYAQVDLHRALAVPPWFDLPGDAPLERAVAYESVDGPILSLSIEDQVVFLAAHHATHAFDLDARHREDVVRLLERHPVDWTLVAERARRAHLTPSLGLCATALAARGVQVPPELTTPGGVDALRRRWLERFVAVPALERTAALPRQADVLLLLPVLSSRPLALPRFALHYLKGRAADGLALAKRSKRR